MGSNATVDELIQLSGIKDFKNLTQQDASKLLELIGKQRLKEAHVKALVEIAPGFLQLSTQVLKSFETVAQGAKSSQKDAFSAIQSAINALAESLRILAERAQSDETHEKIAQYILEAGKLYVELAKMAQEMNSENNGVWKAIAGFSLAALAVVAVVLVMNNEGNVDQTT